MTSARPLTHEPIGTAPADQDLPRLVADLRERITAKLAEAEDALRALAPKEGKRASKSLAELRLLVTRQFAVQESLEELVEGRIDERTREQVSLSNFLQTHYEREKASLARELHDALSSILTPLKMDLVWLEGQLGSHPEYSERMRRLGALIDSGIDFKRRIIEELHPSLLDHLGLASALQWYIEEMCRCEGIECRLTISERLERLPPDMEIALYRLVQESVNNVVKHARAKVLDLALSRTEDGLKLSIADDGVGIADLEYAKKLSHGLAGMMNRVRSIDGSFEVHSQPGRGTRIDVFVPLKNSTRYK